MKLRKILAAVLAGAMVLGTMSVAAFADDAAADGSYEAFLMYTDSSWGWGNWAVATAGVDATITGDGTYTVSVTKDSLTAGGVEVTADAAGATVFCVDIEGLADAIGASTAGGDFADTAAKQALAEECGLTISNVCIAVDGADYATDVPVLYGDIEGNGKIRIEIFNAYGETNNTLAGTYDDLTAADSIAVTFTIDGLDADEVADDAADDAADEAATEDSETGDATVLFLLAAVASLGVAFVGVKKFAFER